jgi:hypothetical protein
MSSRVFTRGPGFGKALSENENADSDSHTDSMNMNQHEGMDNKEVEGMDEEVQEVMKDNLELMLEVVMKIREDEEFAKNIYSNCPRLQHLLDQHPDLRPVFEDPNLVRINFEQVYRDNGGVLPEDEPKKKSCLSKVVNHPCFKVLKFFLLIKKLMNCIMGGGFAMIKGCLCGLCFEDVADQLGDGVDGGDAADHQPSPENIANKEQLNAAADHMAEPEVQENMNELLENNPDELAEAIENDPELKALRDSNPLCAELMADPDTMRILVDPDNLRALGECPDLIEQDFANPDYVVPDIEVGGPDGLDGVDVDGVDADADADADAEEEGEEEEEFVNDEENPEEDLEEEEEEEEEGMIDDFEMEEQDGNKSNPNANKSKAQKKDNKKQENGNGGGGFLSSLGAGITDMVAAEFIGVTVSEMTGGDDELAGLEDVPADDLADAAEATGEAAETAAESAASAAQAAGEAAELLLSDDVADNLDNLEDGLDEIEDTHDDRAASAEAEDANRNASRAKAGAIGAGVGLAATGIPTGRKKKSRGVDGEVDEEGNIIGDKEVPEGEEEEEEEEEKKKSRFGFIGNMVGAVATAAKEHVATAILGDDFGEMLVEKQEEDKEEDDEEKNSQDGDLTEEEQKKKDEQEQKKKDEQEKKEKKGRRRFRKKAI